MSKTPGQCDHEWLDSSGQYQVCRKCDALRGKPEDHQCPDCPCRTDEECPIDRLACKVDDMQTLNASEVESRNREIVALRAEVKSLDAAYTVAMAALREAGAEVERLRALCAMEIMQKDEGLWLLIKAPSGKRALIWLHEAPAGSIVDSVLHEMAAGQPRKAKVDEVPLQGGQREGAMELDERCQECNAELSACGGINLDGTPTMDCEVCKLRAEVERLKAEIHSGLEGIKAKGMRT